MNIRTADKISKELERLVFTGELQNGERLDEIKLATLFGVSRTPVREAIQKLATSGLAELELANEKCQRSLDQGDADQYYLENEHFHHLIYKSAGNEFLEREALKLHRRLKPFRRIQLHLRGRMKQSMDEHREIVKALTDADSTRAADTLRDHVAIQGEKFNHLMTSLKDKSI